MSPLSVYNNSDFILFPSLNVANKGRAGYVAVRYGSSYYKNISESLFFPQYADSLRDFVSSGFIDLKNTVINTVGTAFNSIINYHDFVSFDAMPNALNDVDCVFRSGTYVYLSDFNAEGRIVATFPLMNSLTETTLFCLVRIEIFNGQFSNSENHYFVPQSILKLTKE